jgi:F-type H+-transporting ATPase subunit gamma
MPGLKTIRRRITSIKNTKQITRAMKLVSAAKLRRAQDLALGARAFSGHLSRILASVAGSGSLEGFELLENRKEKKSRIVVVISADRGLCGGYNTNLLKAATADAKSTTVDTRYVLLGRRAVSAGNRSGWNIINRYEALPDDASLWAIDEITSLLVDEFVSGRADEVVVFYTQFVSAMTQKVVTETLLPVGHEPAAEETESAQPATVLTDPSREEIIKALLPQLLRGKIVQAGLESKASEHAARMTAMDSATNNADDLMAKLQLFYNRARQSSITKDLIDIIGGAEAIS